MQVTSSARAVEQSALLRAERTAALTARLREGDFDAARYESTPRRRAERLASVLTRMLSKGTLKRRLRKLGVAAEFCGGELLAVSVEGGGIDVRRADGRGQVVTGPGLDERLLDVFPELVPFTLRNLTLTAPFGISSASANGVWIPPPAPDQPTFTAYGVEAYDLTLFLTTYSATAAEARIGFACGGPAFNPGLPLLDISTTAVYVNADYASLFPWSPFVCGGSYFEYKTWPAGGVNWVNTHAEQSDAIVGDTSFTATFDFSPLSNPPPGNCGPSTVSRSASMRYTELRITYDVGPCSTCTLDLQVNSACDGGLVDGGTFDLGNGQSCTQSGGTCTISGISHGSYDWTWTKEGWQTKTGTFVCECEGGSSTLFLSVVPDGGCPADPGEVEVTIDDFCTELSLEGVLIVLDADTPDEEQCTTGADGICYFENVAEGEHTLTVSKDGYQSRYRIVTKTAERLTVTIALIPEGGCPGDTAISMIVGVPNSAAAQFTQPVRASLQVGVPVGAQVRFGERRQRPHVDSV